MSPAAPAPALAVVCSFTCTLAGRDFCDALALAQPVLALVLGIAGRANPADLTPQFLLLFRRWWC